MAMENSGKSAKYIASIDHLLSSILFHLPIKALLRFRSVSKSWFALISSPIFRNFRSSNPNRSSGLFLPSSNDHERFEFVSFRAGKSPIRFRKPKIREGENPPRIRVLHSSNGLLLCCSITLRDHTYYVYNPTTQCSLELPQVQKNEFLCYEICGMSLAFDPVRSHHYNVVCVWKMDGDFRFQIEVYSSESHCWRSCGESSAASVDFSDGVYWDGAVHWMCIRNEESLYYNVERQVFDKMPKLNHHYGWSSKEDYYFGESCGHLHFVLTRAPNVKFFIFEMKRDYSEWFVKYELDLLLAVCPPSYKIQIGLPWITKHFSVVSVVRGGANEEDVSLILETPQKVIQFDLASKTSRILVEFEDEMAYTRYPGIRGYQYIESIYCVCGTPDCRCDGRSGTGTGKAPPI